jgi:murein DD-endopeptidase MepM/ murein hydrolase activator NlpD
MVIAVLLTHVNLLRRAQQADELAAELAESHARLKTVNDLSRELEQMRSFQERLLIMLGVQGPAAADDDSLLATLLTAGTDTQEYASDELQRTAAVVMTPPPDLWPVSGYVTREFREGDQARGTAPHHGIDIVSPEDAPIVAAGKGRVLRARWDDFLGNFLEIQHGFDYVTVYGHCSRLVVQEGDRVDRGQLIGHLGGTGQASAPHLHFEVWKEGVAIDPRQVLPGDPPR